MKHFIFYALFFQQLSCSFAFSHHSNAYISRTTTKLHVNSSSDEIISRRNVLKSASLLSLSSLIIAGKAPPAGAKDKEPVTRESVQLAFQNVRDQLESPDGGVKYLQSLIEKEDFEGIMEFTKNYDLEFRKAKMVKARKLLTSKEDKERALYLSNSVTFDLIGMNKGARPGQYDIEMVKKYFGELITDVTNFLELEQGIDYSAYGL